MKIAICFAGFLRSFPAMIGNWNYRLRNYDCEFFIHSPNTYYAPLEEGMYDSKETKIVEHQFMYDCFGTKLKNLNLFSYETNDFKNVTIQHNIPEKNQINQYNYRILSYHYNIQEVTKMVLSSNINYDYVMITRGDLNLFSDFDFNILDHNKIFYPWYWGITNQGTLKGGTARVFGTDKTFNDQIFIGTPENIKIFSNVYDCIPQYYSEGIMINSETILGQHCIKNNVDFGSCDIVKYEILRFASHI